ncbi:hypothetical protein [Halobaculum sp. P14]|uniref:hypothetical protein n=1 Tax=Halobaculum sp. P14 TaxID=3421638 RepID=UPI003EBD3598
MNLAVTVQRASWFDRTDTVNVVFGSANAAISAGAAPMSATPADGPTSAVAGAAAGDEPAATPTLAAGAKRERAARRRATCRIVKRVTATRQNAFHRPVRCPT